MIVNKRSRDPFGDRKLIIWGQKHKDNVCVFTKKYIFTSGEKTKHLISHRVKNVKKHWSKTCNSNLKICYLQDDNNNQGVMSIIFGVIIKI